MRELAATEAECHLVVSRCARFNLWLLVPTLLFSLLTTATLLFLSPQYQKANKAPAYAVSHLISFSFALFSLPLFFFHQIMESKALTMAKNNSAQVSSSAGAAVAPEADPIVDDEDSIAHGFTLNGVVPELLTVKSSNKYHYVGECLTIEGCGFYLSLEKIKDAKDRKERKTLTTGILASYNSKTITPVMIIAIEPKGQERKRDYVLCAPYPSAEDADAPLWMNSEYQGEQPSLIRCMPHMIVGPYRKPPCELHSIVRENVLRHYVNTVRKPEADQHRQEELRREARAREAVVSELQKSLDEANDTIAHHETTISKLESSLKKERSKLKKALTQVKELNQNKRKRKVLECEEGLSREVEELKEKLEKSEKRARSAEDVLRDKEEQFADAIARIAPLRAEIFILDEKLSDLRRQNRRLSSGIDRTTY